MAAGGYVTVLSFCRKKEIVTTIYFLSNYFFFVEKKFFQIFPPKRPESCTIERVWKFYPFLPKTEVKKVDPELIYGQKTKISNYLKYEIMVFRP